MIDVLQLNVKDIGLLLKDKLKAAYIFTFAVIFFAGLFLLTIVDSGKINMSRQKLKEAGVIYKLSKETSDLNAYIDKFNVRFLVKENVISMMEYVLGFTKGKKMNIKQMTPGNEEIFSRYLVERLLVDGTASYDDLWVFIEELENSDKFLVVEKMEVKAVEESYASISKFIPYARENAELTPEEDLARKAEMARLKPLLNFSLVIKFMNMGQ
ncbi:MAG: hypothetical protein HQL30_08180 [Candidatus Omnitrophica bacterium]|nr:hypothetical protein [Candidatus Omnitrophota bacterium]